MPCGVVDLGAPYLSVDSWYKCSCATLNFFSFINYMIMQIFFKPQPCEFGTWTWTFCIYFISERQLFLINIFKFLLLFSNIRYVNFLEPFQYMADWKGLWSRKGLRLWSLIWLGFARVWVVKSGWNWLPYNAEDNKTKGFWHCRDGLVVGFISGRRICQWLESRCWWCGRLELRK